jgi:hypothetical protein
MLDRKHVFGRLNIAQKWTQDFSLGHSSRNPQKSDQALKTLQHKFRLVIDRGNELVRAFLRPHRAEFRLDGFPGASPQALVFGPFQGEGVQNSPFAVGRSPIHLLLGFVLLIFACSPCAAQSASSTDAASQPVQPAQPAQPAQASQPAQPVQPAQPAPGTDAGQPAQTPQPAGSPAPASSPAASPSAFTRSQNVTINLINRLVQRGVLTKEDAAELIKMAEEDAAAARAEAAQEAQARQAAQTVPLPTATASPESATAQELATSPQLLPDLSALPTLKQTTPPPSPAPVPEPTPALVAGPNDTVRVTYIPEVVKKQMRDEIEQEVLAQAREENWAAPRTFPDWVSRIRLFGDIRVRYEGLYYPSGNDNTGAFPNFNAINTGPPFDVSGNVFSPQLNVDKTRNRVRLRARAGLEADLGDGFTIGIRGATGENDSPVTENQTLGVANGGQGGNFSRYSLWLDRAFLRYEFCGRPDEDLAITVGRFDNPFFGTTMIWADDLGFDGFVLQGRYQILKGVTPFITLGLFPVFNTDLNFATNNPSKFSSEDKWLYAGQIGTNWRINRDFSMKVALAVYDFDNIEGHLSTPFVPLTSSDAGNTDDSRPAFAQKGNTYMALRRILATAQNNFGTIDQFQYFGLATAFRELAFTGELDFNHFEPFRAALVGEYVTNLAFHGSSINAVAVNNRGTTSSSGTQGSFAGGNTAWIIGLKVGSPTLEKRWDWNLFMNYRYVESDAVVDGFNDSDFGGGGTNLKGYVVGGSLALSPNVWLTLRWLSANAVAGPPFKNDILQFDINGRF